MARRLLASSTATSRGAGGETRPGELAADGRSPERCPGRASTTGARARCATCGNLGIGVAGLLGDLVATGEPVLVVAAHAPHRARALQGRVGGFAVTSWAALEDDPGLARAFAHVVALDPPAHPHRRALARTSAWNGLDPPGLGRR